MAGKTGGARIRHARRGKTMYVYIISEKAGHQGATEDLFTVGFYRPDGKWEPESDHRTREEAAERTAWLNGSRPTMPASVIEALNMGDGTYRP